MAKLVTFDVTNTILKVAGSVGYQYAKIAKRHGVEVCEETINKAFKTVWRKQNEIHPNFCALEGETSGKKWWSYFVQEIFKAAGYMDNVNELQPINDDLYSYFSTGEPWEILPGSRDVLCRLRSFKTSRRLSVGAISNTDERLESVLEQKGLMDNFDFVLTSVQKKSAKPDEGIFLKALELAGVKPNEAIHVGDNVDNDYHGALKVGMKPLLIGDRNKVPVGVDAKYVIANLEAVLKFV